MQRVQPFPVAVALSFILIILLSICVLLHLLFSPATWPMVRLWEILLPGFTWISTLSFFLAVLEIFFIAFYIAYVFVPLYNFFNERIRPKEGTEMKPLRFKPVALTVASFGAITYVLCVVFDFIFPQWAMNELWEILLPGFTWISVKDFFIGLVGVALYGIYIAAVFVPLYNNFYRTELPEVK